MDGYVNQDYVLIADVDTSHCGWLDSVLNIWTDIEHLKVVLF